MRPARLRTRLFPFSVAVTAIALVGVTVYAVSAIRDLQLNQTEQGLREKARLLDERLAPHLDDEPGLQALVHRLGASVLTRITVIAPDGRVLADSETEPAGIGDHSDRPEVQQALTNGFGRATRFSRTLQRDLLYVAVRSLGPGEAPRAVIRTALPLLTLSEAVRGTLEHVALVGVLAGLLSAALGLLVAHHLTRPIEELTEGARRFAAGDPGRRLRVGGSREVVELAQAMNDMASEMGSRIATIDRQRTELEGVLESMVEGVVAVDASQHVLRVNSACLRLLNLSPAEANGRNLQEVLRNPELDRLASTLLATGDPATGEISLREGVEERTLEVHGSVLREPGGEVRGAVLVLHDVTLTRRLERVRRDFVANVSHELRTPVTAIKGAIETLQDGARDDPDAAERFLGIAASQAERLETLLEDLLALSRVEQDPHGVVPTELAPLRALAQEALAACEPAAREKGVELALADGPDALATVHGTLLVQALVNLLDNAIKYSDPGTRTVVSLERAGAEACLHVTDQGPGISAEHLPRLFERFYRVDKGRSRSLGGTGLGLAIVRHIAMAHHGRVEVQSVPGKGSRFTVRLPLPAENRAASPSSDGSLTEC